MGSVSYFLYLVTDSSPDFLNGRDIVDVVEGAIRGGVTAVQLREKTRDTADIANLGKRLHNVTRRHGVPLIINDRVDVALAVGAEGVHLGQEDLDCRTARKVLGERAIIGATASSVDEARAAIEAGADYLGIGTVYKTPTKEDTKSILGTAGVQSILHYLEFSGHKIPAVAIGGINTSNAHIVLQESQHEARSLDGLAVVSAIMGAADPEKAASELVAAMYGSAASQRAEELVLARHMRGLLYEAASIVQQVAQSTPLSHNMTNLVVQNFAANVALAVGGSPIMAGNGDEAPDLAQIEPGALVINMGSCDAESVENYVKALTAYNAKDRPVLLDPVGGGATQLRRQAVRTLLGSGHFTVIKGNEGEIKAALTNAGAQQQQRGVDSAPSDLTLEQRAELARELAVHEKCVVLLTGVTDIITDHERTYAVANGHPLLGRITGSGCTLGTTVSCCLAVRPKMALEACLAGVLLFELAAERAAAQPSVEGPGTFVPKFIDKLVEISDEAKEGGVAWVEGARVSVVKI